MAVLAILSATGTLGAASWLIAKVRRWQADSRLAGLGAAREFRLPGTDRLVEGPLLLALPNGTGMDLRAAAAVAIGKGGMISVSPDQDREAGATPRLIKPHATTFAGWMCSDDANVMEDIKTVVASADDARSLDLLRGRMRRGQHLLLLRGETGGALPDPLGDPSWSNGAYALYHRLPDEWLALRDAPESLPGTSHAANTWPKISMVMVSFNQAPYLEAGIRSILDQGYPNLELIMIDGGSKDGSVDILERYRDKFDVLVSEKDRGQSDGLNKGFDLATGEIVSWLNSDDLLVSGALFQVARAFKTYDVDVVAGGCRQTAADGVTIILSHHNHLPLVRPMVLPLGELLNFDERWLKGCFFFQPEVFFTRDIWQRAGGALRLDLNYVLDYDLWIRMAAAGARIVHIPEYLAHSRVHELQKTTYGETPFMPEVRRLLAEYADGVNWTRPNAPLPKTATR